MLDFINNPQEIEVSEEGLGSGAQHLVHSLLEDPGLVVKFPRLLGRIWDTLDWKTVSADYSLLAKHSPIAPVQTQIVDRPMLIMGEAQLQPNYALIQPFLSGRPVNELDLANRDFASQVLDALSFSFELYQKTGRAIDFLGFESFIEFLKLPFTHKPLGVYNVFVNQGELALVDVKLFDLQKVALAVRPLISLLVNFQHEVIAYVITSAHTNLANPIKVNALFREFVRKTYGLAKLFPPKNL